VAHDQVGKSVVLDTSQRTEELRVGSAIRPSLGAQWSQLHVFDQAISCLVLLLLWLLVLLVFAISTDHHNESEARNYSD